MKENSSILITGGTGSFGSVFVPLTLEKYNPKRLVIYSRDEMKQWEMAKKYDNDIELHKRLPQYSSDESTSLSLVSNLLDENISRISLVLLITTVLFVIIALLLINSSIRLSIYSKRFIIKTMQLVGATKSFIRRPFIWIHLQLGIISSLLALGGLSLLFFELNKRFPELNMMNYPFELGVVFGGVLLLGIGITGISTFFATQRYLNLKTDAVY